MHNRPPGDPGCVNSLFEQPWWLDAVAPGAWSAAEIRVDGELRARLPYVVERRFGLRTVAMPALTQSLGPWLATTGSKAAKRAGRENRLLRELIEKLPRVALLRHNCHHSLTNWLPFYWQGFTQTTRYTYRIDDLSDLDAVWGGILGKRRSEIRKADRKLGVDDEEDLEVLVDLLEKTFRRQGRGLPYSRALVERVDRECSRRGCRRILSARDRDGRPHAVVYLVWDADSAYYLMGGADPDLRGSSATSLLLWEAIQYASTVSKAFDFEGSMIEGVERQFRSFGALQVPYLRIEKRSGPLELLEGVRRAAGRMRR